MVQDTQLMIDCTLILSDVIAHRQPDLAARRDSTPLLTFEFEIHMHEKHTRARERERLQHDYQHLTTRKKPDQKTEAPIQSTSYKPPCYRYCTVVPLRPSRPRVAWPLHTRSLPPLMVLEIRDGLHRISKQRQKVMGQVRRKR